MTTMNSAKEDAPVSPLPDNAAVSPGLAGNNDTRSMMRALPRAAFAVSLSGSHSCVTHYQLRSTNRSDPVPDDVSCMTLEEFDAFAQSVDPQAPLNFTRVDLLSLSFASQNSQSVVPADLLHPPNVVNFLVEPGNVQTKPIREVLDSILQRGAPRSAWVLVNSRMMLRARVSSISLEVLDYVLLQDTTHNPWRRLSATLNDALRSCSSIPPTDPRTASLVLDAINARIPEIWDILRRRWKGCDKGRQLDVLLLDRSGDGAFVPIVLEDESALFRTLLADVAEYDLDCSVERQKLINIGLLLVSTASLDGRIDGKTVVCYALAPGVSTTDIGLIYEKPAARLKRLAHKVRDRMPDVGRETASTVVGADEAGAPATATVAVELTEAASTAEPVQNTPAESPAPCPSPRSSSPETDNEIRADEKAGEAPTATSMPPSAAPTTTDTAALVSPPAKPDACPEALDVQPVTRTESIPHAPSATDAERVSTLCDALLSLETRIRWVAVHRSFSAARETWIGSLALAVAKSPHSLSRVCDCLLQLESVILPTYLVPAWGDKRRAKWRSSIDNAATLPVDKGAALVARLVQKFHGALRRESLSALFLTGQPLQVEWQEKLNKISAEEARVNGGIPAELDD